jgi:iron complex outermembrane receptor protein
MKEGMDRFRSDNRRTGTDQYGQSQSDGLTTKNNIGGGRMKRAWLLAAIAATSASWATGLATAESIAPEVASPNTAVAGHGASVDPGKPDASEAAATGLAEIVVTAQRRSENLQKAALPISAVTGEALAQAGVIDAQSLTSIIPAVQISTAQGPYNLFYLRGVGSFNVNPFSDSPIAFNVDGIAISRPSSTSGLFYDIDRVEVLKGPQGTLYGRNATGGAINVITNEPKLNTYSVDLSSEYGNYGTVRTGGAVNVPFGETDALRVAFLTNDHSGYLSDGTSDAKDRAGRLRYRLEATPDLSIQIGADYYRQGGRGAGGVVVAPSFIQNQIGNTDPRAQAVFAATPYLGAGTTLIPLPNTQSQDNDFWGVNASIDWRTELGTLTVLPAFRRNSLDYASNAAGLYALEDSESEQSSIEARFASDNTAPLQWILGSYYLDETARSALDYNNSGFNLSHSRASLPVNSVAAFGRLTYSVTNDFRVTGGLRYTRDRKSLDATGAIANVLCPAAFATGTLACAGASGLPYGNQLAPQVVLSLATGAPVPFGTTGSIVATNPIDVNRAQTFTKTTYRGGVEWDVAHSSLLYASVETGFKAGGFYVGNIDPVYQPETITAYTLGSKNRLFDNKLQLNLEGFYWLYKNQQVSFITRDADGAVILATDNVGRATIKGFEMDTEFAATPTTLLAANVQYLDATYDKFIYNLPNLGGPPTPNCPHTASGASFIINCSGNVAPESPKWTLTLSAQQTFSLGDGDIVLSAQSKYQTMSFAGIQYLPEQLQRSYWMSGAAITYNAPRKRWAVGAFVNNIESARVMGNSTPEPLVGAALVDTTLYPPRTYGVRVGFHY